MSYAQDVVTLRHGGLEDGALRFAEGDCARRLSVDIRHESVTAWRGGELSARTPTWNVLCRAGHRLFVLGAPRLN